MREPSEGVPMPDGLYCLNDVSTMLHFDSTISLHAKAFLTRLPAASAILGTVIGCHPASCLGRGSGIAFKCLLIRVRATSKVLPKIRITHCAQCRRALQLSDISFVHFPILVQIVPILTLIRYVGIGYLQATDKLVTAFSPGADLHRFIVHVNLPFMLTA